VCQRARAQVEHFLQWNLTRFSVESPMTPATWCATGEKSRLPVTLLTGAPRCAAWVGIAPEPPSPRVRKAASAADAGATPFDCWRAQPVQPRAWFRRYDHMVGRPTWLGRRRRAMLRLKGTRGTASRLQRRLLPPRPALAMLAVASGAQHHRRGPGRCSQRLPQSANPDRPEGLLELEERPPRWSN